MTREVLLITGPGGDAQGWGNMAVTEVLNDTINRLGVKCSIAFVNNRKEFDEVMDKATCDLVWSSLYYLSDREDIVGAPEDAEWISDLLGWGLRAVSGSQLHSIIQKKRSTC